MGEIKLRFRTHREQIGNTESKSLEIHLQVPDFNQNHDGCNRRVIPQAHRFGLQTADLGEIIIETTIEWHRVLVVERAGLCERIESNYSIRVVSRDPVQDHITT